MQTTLSSAEMSVPYATPVRPDTFEPKGHYYPRVLHAQVHPLVSFFLRMTTKQIIHRYCHLNPKVDPSRLRSVLEHRTEQLTWAGADLFYTTTDTGARRMVVLETNSCPSGNKSMPMLTDDDEQGGYRRLLEYSFLPRLKKRGLPKGGLAVLYDKNSIEASGYAATLADLCGETVYLVPLPQGRTDVPARFTAGVPELRPESGQWLAIRAAFRYVTQRPWTRIPVRTKTLMFNPVLGCLAGGRNKMMAAKAYEFFNAELSGTGLSIRTPETIRDVRWEEIPLWVRRFGGYAVVKNPYSNAGQGVWTLSSEEDLQKFLELEHDYDRFIVQGLIGNSGWTSKHEGSRFYHVGTMPDRQGKIYVADLRMMVTSGPQGFRPISIYARRAVAPLTEDPKSADSWAMLGTNLSTKSASGGWDADTDRLILMDRKDFNRLGLGPDDLLEAYIQSVLSVLAIDQMARKLTTSKGGLSRRLFKSMNDDSKLMSEILKGDTTTSSVLPSP